MSQQLGSELRDMRKEKKRSITEVSRSLPVDRAHLNKVELGHTRPSQTLLRRLLYYYSADNVTTERIMRLADYEITGVKSNIKRKEYQVNQGALQKPNGSMNITIDPGKKPVLYSESVFIHSSDYGIQMDFAQRVGPSSQQFVVARIGMSSAHAKKMLEVLKDHIEKYER